MITIQAQAGMCFRPFTSGRYRAPEVEHSYPFGASRRGARQSAAESDCERGNRQRLWSSPI
jgi:hypothetical protein